MRPLPISREIGAALVGEALFPDISVVGAFDGDGIDLGVDLGETFTLRDLGVEACIFSATCGLGISRFHRLFAGVSDFGERR